MAKDFQSKSWPANQQTRCEGYLFDNLSSLPKTPMEGMAHEVEWQISVVIDEAHGKIFAVNPNSNPRIVIFAHCVILFSPPATNVLSSSLQFLRNEFAMLSDAPNHARTHSAQLYISFMNRGPFSHHHLSGGCKWRLSRKQMECQQRLPLFRIVKRLPEDLCDKEQLFVNVDRACDIWNSLLNDHAVTTRLEKRQC
jgi:hypothetical protein